MVGRKLVILTYTGIIRNTFRITDYSCMGQNVKFIYNDIVQILTNGGGQVVTKVTVSK